ncbi:tetratricopeptide repeat protein [Amphritea japonica]|nr:tetratricopeptide repeat protein [Amphritea japonica]
MGTDLMPPGVSNPDGHFEDLPLVNLHDRILALNNTDWRYHDDSTFDPFIRMDLLSRYVSHREETSDKLCGVKDPRVCLFLPAWHKLLNKQGRYLVVLRHWSGSTQSLLHRHSRNLALGDGNNTLDLSFWHSPEQAARMWLASHRRILALLEESPEQCLVVSHRSLLEGLPLINKVNNFFDLKLDTTTPSPIRNNLSQDNVDSKLKSLLSDSLQAELEAIWNALTLHINHRTTDESPHWVATIDNKKSEITQKPIDFVGALQIDGTNNPRAVSGSLQDQLTSLVHDPQLPLRSDELIKDIQKEDRFSGISWEKLARAQLSRGNASGAKHSLMQMIISGRFPPFVYMLLGDCYNAELDYAGAEHCYQQAIRLNKNNPAFHIRLATIWLIQGRTKKAIEHLQQTLSNHPNHSGLALALSNCLDLQGNTSKAINLLQSITEPPEALSNRFIALTMKTNHSQGKALHKTKVDFKIKNPTLQNEIAYLIAHIKNPAAREDLAQRITRHWE